MVEHFPQLHCQVMQLRSWSIQSYLCCCLLGFHRSVPFAASRPILSLFWLKKKVWDDYKVQTSSSVMQRWREDSVFKKKYIYIFLPSILDMMPASGQNLSHTNSPWSQNMKTDGYVFFTPPYLGVDSSSLCPTPHHCDTVNYKYEWLNGVIAFNTFMLRALCYNLCQLRIKIN